MFSPAPLELRNGHVPDVPEGRSDAGTADTVTVVAPEESDCVSRAAVEASLPATLGR